MTTWDEYLNSYKSAQANGDRVGAWRILEKARKLVSDRTQRKWLHQALENDELRWFVAAVFERQPIPRALLNPMLRAALREPVDASSIKWLIIPLAETFGSEDISNRLDAMLKAKPTLATAVKKARYWLYAGRKRRLL